MITDKMDGAKNVVPTFARLPKDLDADMYKSLLTLHIVGVIIHGRPDQRYMFAAGNCHYAITKPTAPGSRLTPHGSQQTRFTTRHMTHGIWHTAHTR